MQARQAMLVRRQQSWELSNQCAGPLNGTLFTLQGMSALLMHCTVRCQMSCIMNELESEFILISVLLMSCIVDVQGKHQTQG